MTSETAMAGKRGAGRIKTFMGDQSGVAAIEFVLLVPIMLGLYFMLNETSNGLRAARKTTMVARIMADLATRPSNLSDADKNDIFASATPILSPFPANKTERRCIKPADVAKFMEGKINHIYTCTYPTKEVGGGKIRLQGSCATKDGPPVPISGQGVFTSDTMHIDAKVSLSVGGLSVPVKASTDARRLGDTCPEPAAG